MYQSALCLLFLLNASQNAALSPAPDWQTLSYAGVEAFRAGDYPKAIVHYERALRSAGAISIPCDETQERRNDLGLLYAALQRFDEARHVIVDGIENECRTVRLPKAAFVSESSALGEVYRVERKYAEADQALKAALDIAERLYGREHPQVALVLTNMGQLYLDEGKLVIAEPTLQRAKDILQDHSAVDQHLASTLNHLAECYLLEGQYAKAQPLLARSVSIYEQTLGPEHPYLAAPLSNLGFLYKSYGQYTSAITVLTRALAVAEKGLGVAHPQIGQTLDILAASYWGQKNVEAADLCLRRAILVAQQNAGARLDWIRYSHDLADLDQARQHYREAEYLYLRSLRALAEFDCKLTLRKEITSDLVQLLRTTGRHAELPQETCRELAPALSSDVKQQH